MKGSPLGNEESHKSLQLAVCLCGDPFALFGVKLHFLALGLL